MKLTLLQGNVFEQLPKIESESIDLVITSPPYWELRNYEVEGQLGAEPTVDAYLNNTIRWVKEVWRVLKPTGSFVLNIGDTFVNPSRKGINNENPGKTCMEHVKNQQRCGAGYGLGGIYKTKQLLSVSSFAYCRVVSETDFVCRGEHIWCKPNVPSPIRSRLKHSHEKLFWFVKDADKYYFDAKAWMKKVQETSNKRYENATSDSPHVDNIGLSPTSCYRAGKGHEYLKNQDTIEHSWRIVPVGAKQGGFELEGQQASEHIAPFPENLIRPYIQSLCPHEGVVLDPFLGSGTTMYLAQTEGRNSIGIELNEKYVEYAKKRLNWGGGLGVEYEEKA